MQEKIIIFLHTYDSARPSWVVIDTHSIVKKSVRHGQPDELALIAADKEVIVLVPAEDVLLTSVNLPKMSRTRLLQALPYALEEQLTSEVDKLHFATSENQSDGSLPVAVVAVEKMEEWLTLLQSWQIQADILCPVTFALPYEVNIWHIAMDGMAIVRTDRYQGFACDKNNLNSMLAIALVGAVTPPQQIFVHRYTSNLTEALEVSVPVKEEVSGSDRYFSTLARQVVTSSPINLLQGHYRVKKSKFPQREKILRMIGYLAAAWIFLLVAYPAVSYFILKHRVNQIENQIAQIYKRQFPQASSIVAPKLRMEEKLHKLTAQIGQNKLLALLGFVGKGMLETPSLKLKRIEFQQNQLTLEITAGSSDDVAAFTDFLQQQGLDVKQQNANLNTNRISATLVIS